MRSKKPNLEWHCKKCEGIYDFRHVGSSVEVSGNPQQHYYACINNCGTTYEQRHMLSLENVRKIYRHVTS